MGENSAAIRARVCHGLAFMGIEIDDAANQAHAPLLSTCASLVAAVVVEPTNEEWIAALAAAQVLWDGLCNTGNHAGTSEHA